MKLNSTLFTIGLLALFSVQVFAQNRGMDRRDKIKALRVGLFTEKMELSSDQAKSFWPLYDSYDAERRQLKTKARREIGRSNQPDISDEERLKSQDLILEYRKAELDLEAAYKTKFLSVITPRQYSQMLNAEHAFNKMLLDELQKRRGRP